MAEGSLSRLDRIEAILEQTTVGLNRLEANQEVLQAVVQSNSAAIERLAQQLEASMSHLVGVIDDFVEEGQQERQVFQAEIQRIWEYLLNQNPGNGNSHSM